MSDLHLGKGRTQTVQLNRSLRLLHCAFLLVHNHNCSSFWKYAGGDHFLFSEMLEESNTILSIFVRNFWRLQLFLETEIGKRTNFVNLQMFSCSSPILSWTFSKTHSIEIFYIPWFCADSITVNILNIFIVPLKNHRPFANLELKYSF